ncbi:MAG: hypothetical protein IKO78_02620 [Bacilli bacterium]|nr:hypothetical protein [Bacilli bacterium]
MREDIKMAKKELKEIKEYSLAKELLDDNKKTNKRMFYIIIVILIMWFITIGYLIYTIRSIDYIDEDSIEIENVSQIDSSHIKIGDDV